MVDESLTTAAPDTQADRVISKFGGPYKLAAALAAVGWKRSPTSIYRWTYAKEKGGTGGCVPVAAMHLVLEAARYEGIFLTAADLDPRRG